MIREWWQRPPRRSARPSTKVAAVRRSSTPRTARQPVQEAPASASRRLPGDRRDLGPIGHGGDRDPRRRQRDLRVGVAEISRTEHRLAQIAADELVLPLDSIMMSLGDTETTPLSRHVQPRDLHQRQGGAAAAQEVTQILLELAAGQLEVSVDDLGWRTASSARPACRQADDDRRGRRDGSVGDGQADHWPRRLPGRGQAVQPGHQQGDPDRAVHLRLRHGRGRGRYPPRPGRRASARCWSTTSARRSTRSSARARWRGVAFGWRWR